jgi:hypothetical protein
MKKNQVTDIISQFASSIHNNILSLNNSKFFAGTLIILLNIGSKFINVQFSKSLEEYMKYAISKQIFVFAMAWMASRDIYTSLILTAVFTVLSEHIFNEESKFCVVPKKYHMLNKAMDTNSDGVISDAEISNAVSILEKANKEKQKIKQRENLMKFNVEYINGGH